MELWREYAELEPFGPVHDDYRFGLLTHMVAVQYGKPPELGKMYPSLRSDEPIQDDPRDTMAALQSWTAHFQARGKGKS